MANAPPFGTVGAAAAALHRARAHVSELRSGKAAIHASGAAAAFRALDGEGRAAAIREARFLHDTEADKPRIYRLQYFKFCAEMWPAFVNVTVRITQLRAFIFSYVVDRGNHAKSAGDIICFIRRATKARQEWALSAADEADMAADARWLRQSFPEPPKPTRGLSLEERERYYRCCENAGAEGTLAAALMATSTSAQMRFTEVIELCECDVTVRPPLGVLIEVIQDKTHKDDLKPHPRVAPRLPLHMRAHDATPRVLLYLQSSGKRLGSSPLAGAKFFTRSDTGAPLTAEYARALLLRFLRAARVEDPDGLLNFSLHFARSTGFNDLSNKLFLGRIIAAEAGGWEEGGCVAESYQRRTAEDLACAIHRNLRAACRDLGYGWIMPPGTGFPGH